MIVPLSKKIQDPPPSARSAPSAQPLLELLPVLPGEESCGRNMRNQIPKPPQLFPQLASFWSPFCQNLLLIFCCKCSTHNLRKKKKKKNRKNLLHHDPRPPTSRRLGDLGVLDADHLRGLGIGIVPRHLTAGRQGGSRWDMNRSSKSDS